jgi:hypothetical protein
MTRQNALYALLALATSTLHHRLRFVAESWGGYADTATIGEFRSILPYQGRILPAYLLVKIRDYLGVSIETSNLGLRTVCIFLALVGFSRLLRAPRSPELIWLALLPLGATCTATADTYPAVAILVWWLVMWRENRWKGLLTLSVIGAVTRESILLGPLVGMLLVMPKPDENSKIRTNYVLLVGATILICAIRGIISNSFPGAPADSAIQFNLHHLTSEGTAQAILRVTLWIGPFALAITAWRNLWAFERAMLLTGFMYMCALPFVARVNELRVLVEPWMLIAPALATRSHYRK